MTARMGGDSKRNVSAVAARVRRFALFKPENAGGEDRRDLGQPLGGGHAVGRQRVRAFHEQSSIAEEAYVDQKPSDRAFWDIRQERSPCPRSPSMQHASLAGPWDVRDLRGVRLNARDFLEVT